MTADYIVVGSGLTGATIARLLSDAGQEVLVIERRAHVGGNVYDQLHSSGVRIHTYGPHYFRTSSDHIWLFVNRFADFFSYEAALMTLVDGQLEHWPITSEYIRRTVGEAWKPAFTGTPRNFSEASLAMMPSSIYEKFVKGYSEKQWGVKDCTLSAALAGRFDVRSNGDRRLKSHTYQGIPIAGYAAFTAAILQNIPTVLNLDYLTARSEIQARKLVIYTGPIDQLFGNTLGPLAYRSQRRIHQHDPDSAFAQPCGQVNNPDMANGPHIRTLEWKHMMPPGSCSAVQGTVLTQEIPFSPTNPDEYEYPFPDAQNSELYARYRALAAGMPDTIICGRLGEYRYYDMDQAIARAMNIARSILSGPTGVSPEIRSPLARNMDAQTCLP